MKLEVVVVRAGDLSPKLMIARPVVLDRRSTQMEATFDSAADLAEALRRAAAAHGRHEEQLGHPDPDWPDWYPYIMQEQTGHRDPASPGAST
jgi:hypothetical protein